MMPVQISLIFAGLFFSHFLFASPEDPVTWHVGTASGSDSADGRTPATCFGSIQQGVDAAQPGDTVLIHPGIYFENVILKRGGTPEKPIRVMADQVGEGRVVLTGAVRSIRQAKTKWKLADPSLGLYRIPFEYRPTRVLASGADLLPYPSLEDLKAFRFVADDYPGAWSGFAWDAASHALYVRLRSDGAYGPISPNEATMAVSPPPAGGRYGNLITRDDNWNLALRFKGAAHVIIDGITFETPGMTGVYSDADDLTVRNCWFFGCRFGVTGREPEGPKPPIDRVMIEQCYYTQYPAFSDAEDVLRQSGGKKSSNPKLASMPLHWQRKAGLLALSGGVGAVYNYETGLTRAMGTGWVIRRNYVYEAFEAFNAGSVSSSAGADIYENRFERICDNVVETEQHAKDLRFHDNLILDAFEPFSWQPQSGAPLPGPIYIYGNTVWQTPECPLIGGAFKIGASDRNWENGKMGEVPRTKSEAPGGFWVVNNTVLLPGGRALTLLNLPNRRYAGFFFLNNVFYVRSITTQKKPLTADACGLVLDGNVVAPGQEPATESQPFSEQAALLAGKSGQVLTRAQFKVSGLESSGRPLFETAATLPSPIPNLTVPMPDTLPRSPHAGAPTREFSVGPQPR